MNTVNQQATQYTTHQGFSRIVGLLLLSFFIICYSNLAKANDKEQLQQLLNQFLTDNTQSALKKHSKFWAEDLIYTSSNGERFGKQFIIDGINNAEDDNDQNENVQPPTYSAENIDIRLYGNTAIVAFKFIADTQNSTKNEKTLYFNTGTFLKRNNLWQAVAWQATKIPVT